MKKWRLEWLLERCSEKVYKETQRLPVDRARVGFDKLGASPKPVLSSDGVKLESCGVHDDLDMLPQ